MTKKFDKFFHKKEEESASHTHHELEAKRYKEEIKRQKYFFKRKGINPQILYNTLVFITDFFDHREDEWEALLRLIIKENEHRRPNFNLIQYWFIETFEKSLNKSEAKYLMRYVKMSSLASDRETKLRDSMDNIDLPPIKYDSWLKAVYNMEGDEDLYNIGESGEAAPRRNYVKWACSAFVVALQAMVPTMPKKINHRKTHPNDPAPGQMNKLSLSSKPVRAQQRQQQGGQVQQKQQGQGPSTGRAKYAPATDLRETMESDVMSVESEGSDSVDLIRNFNTLASFNNAEEKPGSGVA